MMVPPDNKAETKISNQIDRTECDERKVTGIERKLARRGYKEIQLSIVSNQKGYKF